MLAVTPETFVPEDHPLRRIKPLVDDCLARLSPRFEAMYAWPAPTGAVRYSRGRFFSTLLVPSLARLHGGNPRGTRLAHLCCRLMTRRSAGTRAMRAMRAMRVATLFAALALALLAAGCGGDDPSATSTATPASTATAESSQATPTATATPTSTAITATPTSTPTAASNPTSTPPADATPTPEAASPTASPTSTPASTPAAASSQATPTPAVTRGRALTVEEYAQWCAASQPTPASDVTPAEAVAEALAEIERIEPPPELHGFHTALTGNGIALLLLFRELEEGGLAEGEDTLDGLSFVAGLFDRAFEREVAALPEGVRATLGEAGCLWGGLGAAVATPTPPPTAEATEPLVEGVPNGPQSWDTLGQVIARGELKCGVKQTHPLFGFRAADGTVSGFDIEFCKAIAAAVLRDPTRVWYIDASDASTRFELLAVAEIDVLIRATAVTASRDRELGVDFAQPIFYTGQGFAVRKD